MGRCASFLKIWSRDRAGCSAILRKDDDDGAGVCVPCSGFYGEPDYESD